MPDHRFFTAARPLPAGTRVRLDPDGRIDAAGVADAELGVLTNPASGAGDVRQVALRGPGVFQMLAAGPIAAGETVFASAQGRVSAAAKPPAVTGPACGTALKPARRSGDVVEVLRG